MIKDEIAWLVVLGVVTFYMLARAQTQTLLSILVMACFVYVAYIYVQRRWRQAEDQEKTDATFFKREADWRRETNMDNYFVATFPKKGLRYIRENQGFMDIAKGIVIARMFDRARYSDLLLSMDQLQKIYMYILDGRYDAKTQIANFLDMRSSVLEILYSIYFVVPEHLKHVYGVQPYERIRSSISHFTKLSRVMIQVLKSYMQKTVKEPYFPEQLPSAADAPFDPIKYRKLP